MKICPIWSNFVPRARSNMSSSKVRSMSPSEFEPCPISQIEYRGWILARLIDSPFPQYVLSTFPVPREGGWTEWVSFLDCPVSCGGADVYDYRTCTNPSPLIAGGCQGLGFRRRRCNDVECPGEIIYGYFWEFLEATANLIYNSE